MPLFERGYKAAARTELEREVRELEERTGKALEKAEPVDTATIEASANIAFAERLRLISAEQAAAYKRRLQKATQNKLERERISREENKIDDHIKPSERAESYMSLEDARAEIAKRRDGEEKTVSSVGKEEKARTGEKSTEEDERTR